MKTLDQRRLIFSIGLGICVALLVAVLWLVCYPNSLPLGSPSWMEFTLVFFILAVGHEALHVIGFPRIGLDSKTIIGIWPEFGSPYVQYLSPMRRNRFLLATLLPFFVLTIFPLPFLFLFSIKLTESIGYASWISVLNSIGAGSDILIFAKVVTQIPKNSLLIENHDSIYWDSINLSDKSSNAERNSFKAE